MTSSCSLSHCLLVLSRDAMETDGMPERRQDAAHVRQPFKQFPAPPLGGGAEPPPPRQGRQLGHMKGATSFSLKARSSAHPCFSTSCRTSSPLTVFFSISRSATLRGCTGFQGITDAARHVRGMSRGILPDPAVPDNQGMRPGNGERTPARPPSPHARFDGRDVAPDHGQTGCVRLGHDLRDGAVHGLRHVHGDEACDKEVNLVAGPAIGCEGWGVSLQRGVLGMCPQPERAQWMAVLHPWVIRSLGQLGALHTPPHRPLPAHPLDYHWSPPIHPYSSAPALRSPPWQCTTLADSQVVPPPQPTTDKTT